MRETLLVLNAGSSSLAFSVYETRVDRSLVAGAHGAVEQIDTTIWGAQRGTLRSD